LSREPAGPTAGAVLYPIVPATCRAQRELAMTDSRERTLTHFEQRLQERCQVSSELLGGAVRFIYAQLSSGGSCYLYRASDGSEVHAVRLFHTVIPVRWDSERRSLISALPIISLYNKQLTVEAHQRLGEFMMKAHVSWLERRTQR
jgi:hypothetical protein